MHGKMLGKVSMFLLAIGGLNWGLTGLGGFMGSNLNAINLIFGSMPTLEWLIYLLVGLAAVYSFYLILVQKECVCGTKQK